MSNRLFLKSVFGGISISIASFIYLQTGGVIGAVLFSAGLLMILNLGFKLFTGTVGYFDSADYVPSNVFILLGNVSGCMASLVFGHPEAQALVAKKLATPLAMVFAKGVVCGVLIYAAVESFKRKKDYMVPFCVAGFILFGAEHCIADLCYFLSARMMTLHVVLFLLVVASGNGVGAILTHMGSREK